MIVILIKFVFFAISAISNLVTRLIFTATAYLLVLFIQAFRVPGEAIQGALEQVAEAVRGVFEYILELIMELIGSIISSAFDLVMEAVSGSVSVTGTAVGGLVEKTRTSLDGLFNDLPELAGEVSEFVSSLVTDLWNNYKDALGYVTDNA